MTTILLQSIPFMVYGQTAADLPDPNTTPPWLYVTIGLVMTFGGSLIVLFGKGLGLLTDYVADVTGLAFIRKVDELLVGIAATVYQDQVEPWKAASADGKLSSEERKLAQDTAIASLKKSVSLDRLQDTFAAVGEDLHAALGSRVDLAVDRAKNSGKLARSGGKPGDPTAG